MRRIIGTISATLAVVAVLGASAGPASAEDCKTYDGIRVCNPTPPDRQSVLGTYSIDDNGDTTLSDYKSDGRWAEAYEKWV
jgi:hypothetical protein